MARPSYTAVDYPGALDWLLDFMPWLDLYVTDATRGRIRLYWYLSAERRLAVRLERRNERPITNYFDLSRETEHGYWWPRIKDWVDNTLALTPPRAWQAPRNRLNLGPPGGITELDMQEISRRIQENINTLMSRTLSIADIEDIQTAYRRDVFDVIRYGWAEAIPPQNPSSEANKKAEKLLIEKLSTEQLDSWKKTRTFLVKSKTTGIEYKLSEKRTYGIETYLYGKRIGKFCITSKDNNIPICDLLLAQKLLIETDEKAFIETANLGQ